MRSIITIIVLGYFIFPGPAGAETPPSNSTEKIVSSKTSTSPDDDLDHVLLYGKGFAFLLTAPHGWVINCCGKETVLATITPRIQDKADRCHFFIVADALWKKNAASLEQVLLKDRANFRSQSLEEQEREAAPVKVEKAQRDVPRLDFINPSRPQYGSAVYVEEKKALFVFTLSCSTKQDFDRMQSVLASTLASYHFVSENVKMIQKRNGSRQRETNLQK